MQAAAHSQPKRMRKVRVYGVNVNIIQFDILNKNKITIEVKSSWMIETLLENKIKIS